MERTLNNIYQAKKRIDKYIWKTPIEYSPVYSDLIGGEVYLKLENLQLTGSFKIRGVLNKVLGDNILNKEWVTASAGNHGKALAYTASLFKHKCTVYVPENAPETKKRAIKGYGAKLIEVKGTYDEAEEEAIKFASSTNSVYISPYNDPYIIYGQGTIALEIINDLPELDVVVIPVGGGGLASGIALAIKNIDKDIEIIGVQSEASPSMYNSLRAGKIVEVKLKKSIADGLHGNIEKDSITFDILKDMLDDIILVEEWRIEKHIAQLIKTHKQIIEGAAATTLAALDKYRNRFTGKRVCALLTGRNIDHTQITKIINRYCGD